MKLGNLTYYFASKEDLLRELLDAVISSYEIELDQIVHEAEATVEDSLTELFLLILADICTKKTTRISLQTLGALQPRPIRTGPRPRTLCACPNGAQ
jgi:AcrR family transcriptional regulator